MFLHLVVQAVEAFLHLLGRIFFDYKTQIVRRHVHLVRDVLGFAASVDFRLDLLKEILTKKSFIKINMDFKIFPEKKSYMNFF